MNFDAASFSLTKENDQSRASEDLLSPSKNAEYKARLAEGLQLAENSSRILAFKKKVSSFVHDSDVRAYGMLAQEPQEK